MNKLIQDSKTSLGADIRQLRESWGWSRKQLAEHLGKSSPHVVNLEHGACTLDMLLSESLKLGIPWEQLCARLMQQG